MGALLAMSSFPKQVTFVKSGPSTFCHTFSTVCRGVRVHVAHSNYFDELLKSVCMYTLQAVGTVNFRLVVSEIGNCIIPLLIEILVPVLYFVVISILKNSFCIFKHMPWVKDN